MCSGHTDAKRYPLHLDETPSDVAKTFAHIFDALPMRRGC